MLFSITQNYHMWDYYDDSFNDEFDVTTTSLLVYVYVIVVDLL